MKPFYIAFSPAVTELLIHFFPLATIFLFCSSAVLFVYYLNSVQKIEKHMANNRFEEWEEMGKPSIFSSGLSEKRAKFKEFLESENATSARDFHIAMLWERSKRLKKLLTITTWSAFGMYFFTIFAVNYLLGKFG